MMNETSSEPSPFIVVEPPPEMAPGNGSVGKPIAGTPPLAIGQGVVLKGTSQGRQEDIPPDEWIPEELLRYQVYGV
jgi:hypothetical protein